MGLADAFGSLFGSGLGAAGSYASAKALQEDAQQFQTSFYKKRYQRTMADMREAGLNPILAYKTGVGGGASGGIASTNAGQHIANAAGQAAQTVLTANNARVAGAAAKEAELRAKYISDHPGVIQAMIEAEIRARTGSGAMDQLKGFGLQLLEGFLGKPEQTNSKTPEKLRPIGPERYQPSRPPRQKHHYMRND